MFLRIHRFTKEHPDPFSETIGNTTNPGQDTLEAFAGVPDMYRNEKLSYLPWRRHHQILEKLASIGVAVEGIASKPKRSVDEFRQQVGFGHIIHDKDAARIAGGILLSSEAVESIELDQAILGRFELSLGRLAAAHAPAVRDIMGIPDDEPIRLLYPAAGFTYTDPDLARVVTIRN